MCRFLAVCGDTNAVSRFLDGDIAESFQARSRRHTAGWGVGWYENGEPRTTRKPVWVKEERQFLPQLRSIRSPLVFLHVRRATRGGISLENTHPFRSGKWIFAHNGTIVNRANRAIRAWLRPPTEGTTDSEAFFFLLLHFIEQEQGDVVAATRHAVQWVCDISSSARLNFILTDGKTVYAYRRGHTLYRFAETINGGVVEGVSSDPLGRGWNTIKRDWMFSFDGLGRSGHPNLIRLGTARDKHAEPQATSGVRPATA